jgi:hypothetical protein
VRDVGCLDPAEEHPRRLAESELRPEVADDVEAALRRRL